MKRIIFRYGAVISFVFSGNRKSIFLFGQKFVLVFLICCGLLFYSSNAFSQSVLEENSMTNQFWTYINLSYRLSGRWDLYGEMDFRTIAPHEWNRYVVRPSIRYQAPKLIPKNLKYKEELNAGIGFFYTSNYGGSNRLEIRPFQGFRIDWPDRTRLRIRHYVRLEERFDINTNNWKNTFGLRLRYLVELTFKLQGDLIKFNKGVYLPNSIELFWNLIGARQFNDHLRIYSGIGYSLS